MALVSGAVMVLILCSAPFALAGECELISTSQLAMDPSDLFRLAFVQQEQSRQPTLGISVSSAISLMGSPATRAVLIGLDDNEIERIPWTLAENLVAKLTSSGYFSEVAVVAIDDLENPGTDLLLSADLKGIALGTGSFGAIQILSRGRFTKASGMRVEFRLSDTSTQPLSQQFSCTSMKGAEIHGLRAGQPPTSVPPHGILSTSGWAMWIGTVTPIWWLRISITRPARPWPISMTAREARLFPLGRRFRWSLL